MPQQLDQETLELLKQILAGSGGAKDPRLGQGSRPMPGPPPMSPSMGGTDYFAMKDFNAMPPPQPMRQPAYDAPSAAPPPADIGSPFGTGGFARGGAAPPPMMGPPQLMGPSPPPDLAGIQDTHPMLPPLESAAPLDQLAQGQPAAPATPPEKSIWDLLRGGDPDQRRLQGMTDIAEGLGKFRVRSGAGIRAGIGPPEPFVAEGLRRRSAELQDQLSPSARKSLEEYFGFKVPEGMRFSQLQKLLPGIASVAGRRESQGVAKQNRVDMFNMAKAERDERAKAAADWRQKQAGKLSPKQTEGVNAFDRAIAHAQIVIKEKPNFNTGPILSRFHTLANWAGLGDAQKSTFKQTLADVFNKYINDLSGKAVTVQEGDRLREATPRWEDQDATFEGRAKRLLYMLELDRDIYLGNLEKSGKDVDAWANDDGGNLAEGGAESAGGESEWGIGAAGEAPAQDVGGKRAVVGPNGQSGKLLANTDLSKYPGWSWK